MTAAGLFIAVGNASKYSTSEDGVAWEPAVAMSAVFGAGDSILDASWSPELELWVVVGAGGKIGTSPDTVTWTSQTSGTLQDLQAVTWADSLGLFVAVGNNGTLLTSPDGAAWTPRTSGFGTAAIQDVGWAPDIGTLVVCGLLRHVSYSTDGINWTHQQIVAATGDYYNVGWADSFSTAGLFVLSGDNRLYTSPDGATWTARTFTVVGSSILTSNQGAHVWAPSVGTGTYIVGSGTRGSDTSSRTDTSTDGTTWTKRNVGNSETDVIDAFAWAEALGVCVMVANTSFYTSTDLVTWTARTAPTGAMDCQSVVWGATASITTPGLLVGAVAL